MRLLFLSSVMLVAALSGYVAADSEEDAGVSVPISYSGGGDSETVHSEEEGEHSHSGNEAPAFKKINLDADFEDGPNLFEETSALAHGENEAPGRPAEASPTSNPDFTRATEVNSGLENPVNDDSALPEEKKKEKKKSRWSLSRKSHKDKTVL